MSLLPWSEHQPRIIVDSRESRSGIIALLEEREIFEIAIEQLEVGDYIIADLCVERKTGPDFVESLKTGRLFRQLMLLRRAYKRRALLIEGPIPADSPKRAVEGAIVRITAGLQIPILNSTSLSDTVSILQRATLQLYGFTTSSFHSPPRGARTDYAFHQLYVLAGIPGIGLERGRRLVAHFGSLRGVMNASREELLEVVGIGPIQAETIAELVSYDCTDKGEKVQ